MSDNDQIVKLIRKSDRTPWGPECGSILAEAISLADASGEEQLAYSARMRLVVNSSFLNDTELLLATFAICEQQHKKDPLRFPANPKDMGAAGVGFEYTDLYWMWKWIPNRLRESPSFSKQDVLKSIDDLEQVYKDAGLPAKAVLQRRLHWAMDSGNKDEVQSLVDQLKELPDDEHSDCPACSRSSLIEAELLLDNPENAINLLDEIVAGNYECANEPAVAYAHCLSQLAARNDIERINRGISEILAARNIASRETEALAWLAIFFTHSGNSGRAFTIIRGRLTNIVDTPLDVMAHKMLFSAAAVTMRARVAEGYGDSLVPEADDARLAHYLGTVPGGHTAATLATAAEQAARKIATDFDIRNGTTAHITELEKILGDQKRYDLKLNLPADPDSAFVDFSANSEIMFRRDDPVIAEPSNTAELLETVFNLTHFNRPEEAIELGKRWLDKLEVPLDRFLLLHKLAGATMLAEPTSNQEALAAALNDQALVELRSAGHSDIADALAKLGNWLYTDIPQSDNAEILSTIQESINKLEESGCEPAIVGFVISFVVEAFANPELADHALDLVGQAAAVWERLDRPVLLAQRSAGGRANLFHMLKKDPAEILAVMDEFPAEQTARTRAILAQNRAALLNDQGNYQAGYESQLEAFEITSKWAAANIRVESAVVLAQHAKFANRESEVLAIGSFVSKMTASLSPDEAANALIHIADIETDIGRAVEANEQLDQALSLLGIAEQPNNQLLGRANYLKGLIMHWAQRYRDASRHFLIAAEAFENADQIEYAIENALRASESELSLGNIVQAGQLAEIALESLPKLDSPWEYEVRARHLLADAAARAGSERVANEEVEKLFNQAIAVAEKGSDPDFVTKFCSRILSSKAEWLKTQRRYIEALAPANQAYELALVEDHPGRRGYTATLLLDCLRIGSLSEPELAPKAKELIAKILADSELDEDVHAHANDALERLAKDSKPDTAE